MSILTRSAKITYQVIEVATGSVRVRILKGVQVWPAGGQLLVDFLYRGFAHFGQFQFEIFDYRR